MWCSICRQDVPGLVVPGGGQYGCPRCGEAIPSSNVGLAEPPLPKEEESGSSGLTSPPRSDYDEWEMEERLRHLDRIYARNPLSGPLTNSGSTHFRIDSGHSAVPREPAERAAGQTVPSWLARLGRLALGLGLAVTVCGGCLIAWAHFGIRPDLMPMGIPIAVVGQVLLLIGLVLQLDSSGTDSRPPAQSTRKGHPIRLGDADVRIDGGAGTSPDFRDLATRLDELARKLEDREGQSRP